MVSVCRQELELGAYPRGLRGAFRGRKRMQQKHRDLVAKRKIDDEQLLALMRQLHLEENQQRAAIRTQWLLSE